DETRFRRNWVPADESRPSRQTVSGSSRGNQKSLRRAIRRQHIDQSFCHRKRRFPNCNRDEFRKISKVDYAAVDVDVLAVAIELALERRLNIDCGERFTESTKGCLFHASPGGNANDPTSLFISTRARLH